MFFCFVSRRPDQTRVTIAAAVAAVEACHIFAYLNHILSQARAVKHGSFVTCQSSTFAHRHVPLQKQQTAAVHFHLLTA
jgi:hypothetical protein